MIQIDARGYSCPEPVLKLKQAAQGHSQIDLLVDNQTSVKICSRFALSKGFSVSVRGDGRDYVVELRR